MKSNNPITDKGREVKNLQSRVEVLAQVKEVIETSGIRNLRSYEMSGFGGFSLSAERAWGCEVRFEFELEWPEYYEETIEGKTTSRKLFLFKAPKITWSSTGHSIARALTAVKTYQEMIELAAELEARFGSILMDDSKTAAE